MRREVFRFVAIALAACAQPAADAFAGPHDALVAKHAAANGVPEQLVHRIIKIESGGNAAATHAGNFGLMQIRLGTARALGYTGDPRGLLDPDTNLTYAVRYLAGAYRAAGCNADRAVSYYQRGYYGARRAECGSAPAPSADVIKPKVVRTETIATSKSGSVLALPVGNFEPRRIPPPPLQPAVASKSDTSKPDAPESMAKLDLVSIPLPPARPEFTLLPKPKVRPAHPAPGAPVHADKNPKDKDSDGFSVVLTSLKKLVTPDKTPVKRTQAEPAMDPPTQVQPPQ